MFLPIHEHGSHHPLVPHESTAQHPLSSDSPMSLWLSHPSSNSHHPPLVSHQSTLHHTPSDSSMVLLELGWSLLCQSHCPRRHHGFASQDACAGNILSHVGCISHPMAMLGLGTVLVVWILVLGLAVGILVFLVSLQSLEAFVESRFCCSKSSSSHGFGPR